MTGSGIPGLEPNEAAQIPGRVTWEEKKLGAAPSGSGTVSLPSGTLLGLLPSQRAAGMLMEMMPREGMPPTNPPIPSVVHQAEGDSCRKDQVSGQTGLLPPAWQSWVSRHLPRAHAIPTPLARLWVCPAPPSPPPSPESTPSPTPCHLQFHNSCSCSSELGLPTG